MLHAPQIFQVAAASLAAPYALVALDCIVNLKQLRIVGMNGQSLCNPSQGCEQIAGGLQLLRSRNPILHRACCFLIHDQGVDGFGGGMRRVQGERLIGQRLRFQPIGLYNRMRLLDQGIGQDGAGERIAFVQFVGFAQQLNGFSGLPLREQLLTFGDKAVGFGFTLDAILGALFQFGQPRIIGEFGVRTAQQIPGASVVARTQAGVDLLNEPRFGFAAGLLVACYLQAL